MTMSAITPVPGAELSREEQLERARSVALRALEASPKTRAQLAERIVRAEIPEAVARVLLDRFEQAGLIDDSFFAQEWVRTRHAGRGLGRRVLRQELTAKGIDGGLIDAALSQIDDADEDAAARALVARLMPGMSALDPATARRRIAGRLARRGYGPGTIQAAMSLVTGAATG